MTGFAASSAESPRGTLNVELKSVNSRFLDIQFRLAEELRATEPMLRELIGTRVSRGKIDCRMFFSAGSAPGASQALNAAALRNLAQLAEQARRTFPDAAPLRLADVLRWPGVLADAALGEDALRSTVAELAGHALHELCAAREREGGRLAAIVAARVADMRERLAAIAPLVPGAIAAYQEKLAQRLREALGSGDDERVRTELAVFGAKTDVDEELTRLGAHLDEVERVLAKGGTVGKRLDFLAQELNREANTLASKAATQKIADGALELKLVIEQIREQVQNIE